MKLKENQKIREALPQKWADQVAKKTGFSAVYVRKVFTGERENLIISEEIIALAQKEIWRKEKINETIKTL